MKDGLLTTKVGFSSKATIGELAQILERVDKWSFFFPSLITEVTTLDGGTQIDIQCPITSLRTKLFSSYESEVSEESICVTGKGTELMAAKEFMFNIYVKPSTKKNRATTIQINTEGPLGSISFIPASSLSLVLTLLKPIMKTAVQQAISKLSDV